MGIDEDTPSARESSAGSSFLGATVFQSRKGPLHQKGGVACSFPPPPVSQWPSDALADRLAAAPMTSRGLSSCGSSQDRRMDDIRQIESEVCKKDVKPPDGPGGSQWLSSGGGVDSFEGKPFSSAMPLIESMLKKCCRLLGFEVRSKAKPTGNVFPLPTSVDSLTGVVGGSVEKASMLRCLCLALNNYSGESLEGPTRVSKLHREILVGLCQDVSEVFLWKERFEKISWDTFFRSRGVDYVGDEVATAKFTSWENLRGSIPQEVGTVELVDLLEGGSRHYVANFEDYLLSEEDRVYTKPPRVMVHDDGWDKLCEGLINSGICRAISEEDIFKVSGKPLLNGMFGVEKGEVVGLFECHRLIMNLIPLNNICRGIQGDVATLPSWASMGPLALMPTEQLLISSEDVRCFFYIFKVPSSWHPFLSFNKEVSPKFKGSKAGRHFLCATVLPMGFKNSVSLAQAVHRTVVHNASSKERHGMSGEQELRKDKPFPRTDRMYRIYLDNYDELEKCDVKMAGIIKGEPSPSVLALRAEYEHWGIPRHPKKAAQRLEVAEVQGAIVNGTEGFAIPKPEKILKYSQLALLLLTQKRCSQKQLQVIAGGLVYISTFRRAILGALNHIWTFIESFNNHPPVVWLEIPALVKLEIARCIALLPLAKLNFRLNIDPTVTASDASTTGGGLTASTGLSNLGQVAASCTIRGDVPETASIVQVLTIGLFDGIGALRVAVDALQMASVGHISVEQEPKASRVLESRFPSTIFVSSVEEVDLAMVKTWACQFSQAGLVLIGAGPPCQGVSGLNAGRRGALKDCRSSLFVHVDRIRCLIQSVFVWAQVHQLCESVQSMDTVDRETMSASFKVQPWALDAGGVSLAHRPRLYWLSWELQEGPGVRLQPPQDDSFASFGTATLEAPVDAYRYLLPGWSITGSVKLPTFTTSRPRETPGRRPAGLDKLTSDEKHQWEVDNFRFPPYQYQYCYQLWKGDEHRLCSPEEREVIMGFPKGYTQHCLPKSLQGTQQHIDVRNTLLGNSWNVTVVTWLISQLGAPLGLCKACSPEDCVRLTAPGLSNNLASFLSRPPLHSSNTPVKAGNEIVLVRSPLPEGSATQMGKKIAHVEARSKEERQKVRSQLGPLSKMTVQPRTRRRYDAALDKFFKYLAEHQLVLPKQRYAMDSLVSEYLEYIWMQGEGRSLASDTLASLQDREPHLRGQLTTSWRLLKTWLAHEIPNRAPPFTEEVVQTIAGHALFHNEHAFALSLLIGFYGLLRTGELLSLRNRDIAQASPSSVAVLSLGMTKGGHRTGAAESVTLTEEDTLRRVWHWKTQTSPGTFLCPSPYRWRKLFNQTLVSLGLDSLEYRPYSLRRGGATFYFQRHGQLDRLLVQGRWQSSKTARIYLNDGLAILAENQVRLSSKAHTFHSQFLRSRRQPLPKLELTTTSRGRAGATGKRPKTGKKKPKKGKDKRQRKGK
eukprot:Skav202157  [mRNA]  locus=scaffold970:236197:240965:- [translate_table: standard]